MNTFFKHIPIYDVELRRLFNQKGSMLPWIVICCAVVAAFVSGYSSTVTRDFKIAANEYMHMQAFHRAQAGLEVAIKTILDDLYILQNFIDDSADEDDVELFLYPDEADHLPQDVEDLLAELEIIAVSLAKETAENGDVSYYLCSQGTLNRSFAEVIRYIIVPDDGNIIGGGGSGEESQTDAYPVIINNTGTTNNIVVEPGTEIYEDDGSITTIMDIFNQEAGQSIVQTAIENSDPEDLPALGGDKELILTDDVYEVTDTKDITKAKLISGSGVVYYNGNLDFTGGLNVVGTSPTDPIIIIVEDSISLSINGGITLENAALIVKGSIIINGQGHGTTVEGVIAGDSITANQVITVDSDVMTSDLLTDMDIDYFPFSGGSSEGSVDFGSWTVTN